MSRPPLRGGRRWRRRAARLPVGLPGPDALEVGPRTLKVGGVLHRTLAVTGYPRQVGPGWLQPLLDHPGPIDVALHLEPVPTALAAERLRRQLARLESSQRLDAAKGRLEDPQVAAAVHDAQELAHRLATGQGRLLQAGLYVTVRGHTQTELKAEVARVQGLLGSLLLDAHPATFRTLQGWTTTLPLGLDRLRLRRTMDTAAVAAAFPFASAELPPPPTGGVLLGRNLHTQGLVCWDRWAQPNYNQVSSEGTRRLDGRPAVGREGGTRVGPVLSPRPGRPLTSPYRTAFGRSSRLRTFAGAAFSARSRQAGLKRIGLPHRSCHRGREIRVAAVACPPNNPRGAIPRPLHQARRC